MVTNTIQTKLLIERTFKKQIINLITVMRNNLKEMISTAKVYT